jgi:hypothetical protein
MKVRDGCQPSLSSREWEAVKNPRLGGRELEVVPFDELKLDRMLEIEVSPLDDSHLGDSSEAF